MAIQGKVSAAREPVVVLRAFPTKRKFSVIIDTGFSGELCLPTNVIRTLGFERVGRETYTLANGQPVHANVHKAEILWFNLRRSVEVIALDNPQGLLGTQLLQKCTLTVQFRKRKVSIIQEPK